MKLKEGKLFEYCKDKGITFMTFGVMCDVSFMTIYNINKDPMMNVSVALIQKIAIATKEHFGKSLVASEYLDWPCLKLKK